MMKVINCVEIADAIYQKNLHTFKHEYVRKTILVLKNNISSYNPRWVIMTKHQKYTLARSGVSREWLSEVPEYLDPHEELIRTYKFL